MSIRSASLALIATFAFALNGCAGATDASSDEGSQATAEGALLTSRLPNVAAISFEMRTKTVTIGAKQKVTRAMTAMKTPTGREVVPRCSFGPATKIHFYDKTGKTIAEGSMFCFRGTVEIEGGGDFSFYSPPGSFDMLDEPLVPADALWGISKVEIEKRGDGAGTAEVDDQASIKKILGAIDLEQEIDADAPSTRCMKNHSVTFFRGDGQAAYAAYSCSSTGPLPDSVKAEFGIPGADENAEALAQGQIKLDPRPIEAVFKDKTSP